MHTFEKKLQKAMKKSKDKYKSKPWLEKIEMKIQQKKKQHVNVLISKYLISHTQNQIMQHMKEDLNKKIKA